MVVVLVIIRKVCGGKVGMMLVPFVVMIMMLLMTLIMTVILMMFTIVGRVRSAIGHGLLRFRWAVAWIMRE